ncbi:MAG TPA: hypothetical protein VNW29_06070 [Candidatus Sulfotelmatobacter sp.]|jgi:hexokinase|nr:hypothetical protein [Candidatus Sulfotelmatobacter sp.]
MLEQQIELVHTPNYHQIQQYFLQELILASQNKPSSLSFIQHQIPSKPLITQGIVQGIVIGGTNYILSTEEVQSNGSRKILTRKNGILPIFDTKETFIDFFVEHFDGRADAIGINFGFQLTPTMTTDGTLDGFIQAKGTKEHTFKGITESVGSLVKSIFKEKYYKNITLSVANDTICLLLAGKGTEIGSLIVGTGFNIGLLQKKHNQTTLINLEAGEFDKFEPSSILKKIDKQTKNPGYKLFEKTVSGKYLARYFNETTKELNLSISPITTSQELSELSRDDHTDVAGNLARAIITRSAFLVSATIAALYEFCNKPNHFVIIGAGSLLWNGWHYTDNIKKQLKLLEVETVRIEDIHDSSINGAIGLITYDNKK